MRNLEGCTEDWRVRVRVRSQQCAVSLGWSLSQGDEKLGCLFCSRGRSTWCLQRLACVQSHVWGGSGNGGGSVRRGPCQFQRFCVTMNAPKWLKVSSVLLHLPPVSICLLGVFYCLFFRVRCQMPSGLHSVSVLFFGLLAEFFAIVFSFAHVHTFSFSLGGSSIFCSLPCRGLLLRVRIKVCTFIWFGP